MEVAGERENGRARGRHASPFFLVPTTFKRLLRRLIFMTFMILVILNSRVAVLVLAISKGKIQKFKLTAFLT